MVNDEPVSVVSRDSADEAGSSGVKDVEIEVELVVGTPTTNNVRMTNQAYEHPIHNTKLKPQS